MKREALYNLVWTVPMAKLAREFQLSDRGMAKLCQRERIPVPPRGYWAKLAAGHAVKQTPLPDRIAGQSEWVMIAPRGSAYGAEGKAWLESRTRQLPDDDAALSLDPAPPSHDRDLHVLVWRTHRTVGSVRVRKRELKASLHPAVERLLGESREDWERRPPYLSAGTQRRFLGPGARRRLALVNALFLALGKAGARPEIADKEGRSIVVTVGRMPVRCQLASTWVRRTRGVEGEERLDFHVRAGTSSYADRFVWKERWGLRLESCLGDIVTGIVVAAELEHRDREWREHEAVIKARAEARREQERQRDKRRQDARAQLIAEAESLRQANDIRCLVAAIRREREPHDLAFAAWHHWALAEADAIDPVRSGRLSFVVPD